MTCRRNGPGKKKEEQIEDDLMAEFEDQDQEAGNVTRRVFIRTVAATAVQTAVFGVGCGAGRKEGQDADGDGDGDGEIPDTITPDQDAAVEDLPGERDAVPDEQTDPADAEEEEELPPEDISLHVFAARNATPAENVQNVIALAGGIARFVDHDDAVVLKPNGQWPLQGYTNTESLKALIDVILNRPGGFGGEIIVAEHVHRSTSEALTGDYCWNISPGYNRTNNWPDMSYFELMDEYHGRGIPNVTAVPLFDANASDEWDFVSGPEEVGEGMHGWVSGPYTTETNGRRVRLAHPIIRSPFSGRLIDLARGVWDGGAYTGQRVRLIFLPTLNNHGSFNSEDYAGPTSAVKCHLGIVPFDGPGDYTLHSVGYDSDAPDAVGEAVGHLITQILSPVFYLTCAEYTGHRSRTSEDATHTRTVGLCTDPVTLDYWMCRYVMLPIAPSQTFMDPSTDCNLRRTLLGCHGKGVGTLDESEMVVRETG